MNMNRRYSDVPLAADLIRQIRILEGRCSGIPDCCSEYFSDVWMPICQDKARMSERDVYLERIPVEPGYIPCPSCLAAKRFAEIRTCSRYVERLCACDSLHEELLDYPPSYRNKVFTIVERSILSEVERNKKTPFR